MKTLSLAAILAMFLVGSALPASAQRRDVDIKAPDGVNLKGTYFPSRQPGPAMLLLHQCNMNRQAWVGLASQLAAAGINVLTVDYRGFGDSGGEHFSSFAAHRPVMADKWPADVDAMHDYLLAQPGVDKARVAVGGASCGVTQSSDLAMRRPEVRTLMVLSGTASDAAKGYIKQAAGLAVFGAAAEGDANAAKGISDILTVSGHPKSRLKIYAGSEHGVPMFDRNGDLQPMIVDWLTEQLSMTAPN